MGIYAQRPGRRAGQLLGDTVVVLWVLAWALVGVVVDQAVGVLAEPARQTARTAAELAANLQDAAAQASRVPGVGDDLRRPFDSASGTLGTLISAADRQAGTIENLAVVAGWLTFLIPVSVLLLLWLPRRVRFYRQARAAQRFLDSGADLDLFALRALAHQPLHLLGRISEDPVAAWRAGDRAVVDRLADLELRSAGLRMPVDTRAELRDRAEPGRERVDPP
ncbi:MAG: hypothetical protein JWP61_14 [Friedmanniella sp.]|nr:hypothetical protein [Friedmanniella sp.]